MKPSVILIFLLFVYFLINCSPSPETAIERRIRRVENSLLVDMGDPPWRQKTLAERMAHYNVPGVSIAVINVYQVEWARSYGVLEAGGGERVTPETLFQTGSIAKPVVAAAALNFVEKGVLELDEDVNQRLVSWQIAENEFTEGHAAPSLKPQCRGDRPWVCGLRAR